MAKKQIKTFRHSLHQPPGVYLLIGIGAILLAVALVAFTGMVKATESAKSPTVCIGWTNCANALADGGKAASLTVPLPLNSKYINKSTYSNYGYSISNASRIDSVVVALDGWGSNANARFLVKVSDNGGITWGQGHTVLGSQRFPINIDVSQDRRWSGTRLGNKYFKIQVSCYSDDGVTLTTCNLDWIPVKVTYAAPLIRKFLFF